MNSCRSRKYQTIFQEKVPQNIKKISTKIHKMRLTVKAYHTAIGSIVKTVTLCLHMSPRRSEPTTCRALLKYSISFQKMFFTELL